MANLNWMGVPAKAILRSTVFYGVRTNCHRQLKALCSASNAGNMEHQHQRSYEQQREAGETLNTQQQ